MGYRSLLWEDVEEGQALPPITYELSLARLVAFVRATGLLDYIHFDRDYAQAVGMRDAFMATPHIAALFSRLLTDWSGPEADILSQTFQVRAPSCTNDILHVTGRVGRKYQSDQGEYLVDIAEMKFGHGIASVAAIGSATMVLPSRAGGRVRAMDRSKKRIVQAPDADMPEFAKSSIGNVKSGHLHGDVPLTEHEIHLWCECLEDWNPVYWDKSYATTSRHGGLVAPPGVGWFYGAGAGVLAGVGYLKPGANIPEPVQRGLTGLPLLQALREGLMDANAAFTLTDFPEAVVILARDDYFAPVRPGDLLHNTRELLNCSSKKRTRVGEGYFITYANSFYNQRNELVKMITLTLFHFHP